MDKELEDVRAFHNKFDILDSGTTPTMLTKRKLQERIECMQEELDEFKKAVDAQDFPEQADALIDLVYFAKGTAVMMGLPWDKLWDDVQRANMTKVRGVGKRGHAVDMVKPYGWKKPDGETILKEAGFDRSKFMQAGEHLEVLCLDDDAGHKLLHRAAEIITRHGGIVGDYMMAPVCLFDKNGKIHMPDRDRSDLVTVLAKTRKGRVENFDNDVAALVEAGKIYHLYSTEVRDMWPGVQVGDEVSMVDPATFTAKKTAATEELIYQHNGWVYFRFGVNGEQV